MKEFKDRIRFDHTIWYYAELIDEKIPFALTRWGDGEFSAMLGDEGHNCDGHMYYPEMGNQLEQVILNNYPVDERFYYGLLPIAHKVHGERLDAYFAEHQEPKWVNGRVIMDSSVDGQMGDFCGALGKRMTMLVGPGFIVNRWWAGGLFTLKSTVTIPDENAYLRIDEIIGKIYFYLRNYEIDVILFCAGMMTEIIIDYLWNKLDQQVTLIDMGSVFDPYFGRESRKYMKGIDWHKFMREANKAK